MTVVNQDDYLPDRRAGLRHLREGTAEPSAVLLLYDELSNPIT
jgi:hypothetical protein